MRLLIIAITILWATEVFAPNVYYTEACFDMMEERIETLRDIRVTKLKIDMYLQAKSTKKRTGFAKIAWDNAVMEITDATYSASKKYDLSTPLIMAIIETESSWRPDVTGEQGEAGLMQIKQQWCPYFLLTYETAYNIDINIDYGSWKIRHELDFADGDLDKALMEYNGVKKNIKAGKTYVAKVRATMARINSFMTRK